MALLLGALQREDLEAWHPFVEFASPVVECRLGHDNEVAAGRVAVVLQVAKERDGLQCFAETHLVGQNAIDAVVVQGDEPVEALNLVVLHRAALDVAGTLAERKYLIFGLLLQHLLVLLALRLAVVMPVVATRAALLSALVRRLVKQGSKLGIAVLFDVDKVLEQLRLAEEVAEALPAVDRLLTVHLAATRIETLVLRCSLRTPLRHGQRAVRHGRRRPIHRGATATRVATA